MGRKRSRTPRVPVCVFMLSYLGGVSRSQYSWTWVFHKYVLYIRICIEPVWIYRLKMLKCPFSQVPYTPIYLLSYLTAMLPLRPVLGQYLEVSCVCSCRSGALNESPFQVRGTRYQVAGGTRYEVRSTRDEGRGTRMRSTCGR